MGGFGFSGLGFRAEPLPDSSRKSCKYQGGLRRKPCGVIFFGIRMLAEFWGFRVSLPSSQDPQPEFEVAGMGALEFQSSRLRTWVCCAAEPTR